MDPFRRKGYPGGGSMSRDSIGPGGPIRRNEVFERDDHTCVYCRRSPPDVTLSVDHVEPRAKGGDNSRGNVVTACTECNLAKGPLPAWAFLAERPEARASFLAHATYVWPRLRTAVLEAARHAGTD